MFAADFSVAIDGLALPLSSIDKKVDVARSLWFATITWNSSYPLGLNCPEMSSRMLGCGNVPACPARGSTCSAGGLLL